MNARAPSREEIENLCVLHTVGRTGCSARELAVRLGLAPAFAPALAEALAPLVQAGWLRVEEEWFYLTEVGGARVTARLEELGID